MDQEESAVASLAELLRYPDVCGKSPLHKTNLSAIKDRIARDKAALDLQLKSGVQTHVDLTTAGLNHLTSAGSLAADVGADLDRLHAELASCSASAVPGFNKLATAAAVNRNFRTVLHVVQCLRDLPDQLDRLQVLIDHDGTDVFESAMPNLLRIHFDLSRLRSFRDVVLLAYPATSSSTTTALTSFFSRLDSMAVKFDHDVIAEVAQNLLEVLREGNSSLIVRWAKIVEIENTLDRRANAAATATRTPRNYDKIVTNSINLAAADLFDNCAATFRDDPDALLDNLVWVFRDLLLTKSSLTQCVPKTWNIVDRFVAAYHQQTYMLLKSLVTSQTEAGTLLNIIRWSYKYADTMINDLNLPAHQLVPPLLDGQQQEILTDYMNLICSKLSQWINTLSQSEFDQFKARTQAPDVDPDGMYGLASTPILFQMITQQVSLAIESDDITVAAGVVAQVGTQLTTRQQASLDLVRAEIAGSNTNPDDAPGGLVEYSIAVANDQVRGADYTDAIISRQVHTGCDGLVHSESHMQLLTGMVRDLENSMDGFIATAKSCVHEIINMIMFDLQPVFATLFTSNNTNTVTTTPTNTATATAGTVTSNTTSSQEIVRTFEEYNVELNSHLNPDLYRIYVDDLLDSTLHAYVTAVTTFQPRSSSSSSSPSPLASSTSSSAAAAAADAAAAIMVEQIKADVSVLYPFFSSFTDAAYVQSQFKSLEYVMTFLTAHDPHVIVSEFLAMRQPDEFPDTPVKFLHGILTKARTDLDAKTVRLVIDQVNAAIASPDATVSTDRVTFMSEYK
ncbi:exocyst complex component Sec6-domain-containing protein [Lipomyces japonicus]|uniref:exocyst complex component Sec6-domain-containing protein n=1 Tax=Lipomyces japonicus TaxID=56871 RepID=UPI0034CFDC87